MIQLPDPCPTRLHLGCGAMRLDGWLNVDGQAEPVVGGRAGRPDAVLDIHADLGDLPQLHFEHVYWCHGPEHVFPDKLPEVLENLCEALRFGGRLTVCTTDVELIYRNRFLRDDPETDDGPFWEDALFGEVASFHHPFAAHRSCFTYAKLERLLLAAGFGTVRPWRPEDYPEILAIKDYAVTARNVSCYAEGIR